MPKTTTPDYEDDAYYHVALARPIRVGPAWLRPEQVHRMKGAFIKQLLADNSTSGAVNVTGKADDGRPAT